MLGKLRFPVVERLNKGLMSASSPKAHQLSRCALGSAALFPSPSAACARLTPPCYDYPPPAAGTEAPLAGCAWTGGEPAPLPPPQC
eukprot:345076-Prorocentrum_minimum.AAC.1